MKKTAILVITAVIVFSAVVQSYAAIRYINGYHRSNGTYVGGHYRDTSHDGNPYNNANYLGYND